MHVDRRCMPAAKIPMVDGSLPSSATFNAAVEESRISMEACNATQAEMAETIRGMMQIVAGMETVGMMVIMAGMETVGTMGIVVEIPTMVKTETGDETETMRTTGNHAVHISRAARMSAPAATPCVPVARRKTVDGDKRRSETTTGVIGTSPTIMESYSAPGKISAGVFTGRRRPEQRVCRKFGTNA